MGRYRSVMVGAPTFRAGEEVILCLGRAPALPYVLGLRQGVFRVRRRRSIGERVVASPVLLADAKQTPPSSAATPPAAPMSLDQFGGTLRSALARATGRGLAARGFRGGTHQRRGGHDDTRAICPTSACSWRRTASRAPAYQTYGVSAGNRS